ncbi:MAG: phosphotransferase [Planctomycetota bacterium]
MSELDPADRARLEATLGTRVRAARPIHRGYTPAQRWLLTLADGRSAFAKVGVDANTAGWLRTERELYAALAGSAFLPRLLGFVDDPARPALVLEDLSAAHWPPPWTRPQVDAVLAALEAVHAQRLPLAPIGFMGGSFDGWTQVAQDPAPFLGLELCSPAWLEAELPTLLAAEAEAELGGDALLHFDVRSDNLCLRDGRALLIDWNHACCGNPEVDLAFFLPSLAAEGGPPPEALLPGRPALAALISGFFAARAGLPVIPHAPRVREIQRLQLEAALPWAVRALGLSAPR